MYYIEILRTEKNLNVCGFAPFKINLLLKLFFKYNTLNVRHTDNTNNIS